MLTPDFSQVLGFLAGLRPYRPGGVRLEVERWDGRPMIHNYGHGGSGITLAPGSAIVAAELVAASVPPGSTVAVLGAGLVGLTTARELMSRGFVVTVYASAFSPSTTSDVAGGVWHPIEVGESPELARLLTLSYEAYASCHVAFWHPVYFEPGAEEPLPPQLSATHEDGFTVTKTWLVMGSAWLEYLRAELLAGGVSFVAGELDRPAVLALGESAWVNCLGAGAGRLCGDDTLVPIRGQLVRLAPVGENYTLIHRTGYVISRPDCVLLGGTFEHGVWDPTPDPAACAEILARNRAWFARL